MNPVRLASTWPGQGARRAACALAAALALACAVALVRAPGAAAQVTNAAQPHPRLGLYAGATSAGFPFVRADQTLNQALLDSVSRYDSVILPLSPFTEYRPDVLAGLRARHPGIKLYAYTQADHAWPANSPDSLVHLDTLHYHLVRDVNGFLYDRQGRLFPTADINLAHRAATGRYDVADTLADFYTKKVWSTGKWDGIFFDRFCGGILWDQSPSESIDVVRAGYPNAAAFDTAWKAGADELASRLRKLMGSAPVLIGNCGQSAQYAWLNGWMHEDFPNQNGKTWNANMFRVPGGYTVDDANFRSPQSDWISAWPSDVTQPYSGENMRRARFTLGSAALCDGYGVLNPDSLQTETNYLTWWYDEYAVDLRTGRSSSSLANTGWLGSALGPYTQLPSLGPVDVAGANPGFETDLSGWTFYTNVGSTWTRDTVQPASGVASAHVHVVAAGANGASTKVTTVGYMTLLANLSYRISFWIRSAAPRAISVAALDLYRGTDAITRTVYPTTTWQHYDLDVTGPAGDVIAALQFRFGGQAIDTWIDDVHLTQTGLAVYRRDFQNGIVLVNPLFSPMPVVLDVQCRRVLGTHDLVVNDGSLLTQVTLPADDALFLLRASLFVDAGGGAPGDGLPKRLAWRSIAPNPLPPGATAVARFALPRPDVVEVDVFDVAGRRVRAFGARESQAGENAVTWDGRDDAGARLPRGLYFVRAAARGGEAAARKVVLE